MAFFPTRSAYKAIRGSFEARPATWPRDVDSAAAADPEFAMEDDRRSAPRS